jgi:hypothetical protein
MLYDLWNGHIGVLWDAYRLLTYPVSHEIHKAKEQGVGAAVNCDGVRATRILCYLFLKHLYDPPRVVELVALLL